MLDPALVADLLGVGFEYRAGLGTFGDRSGRYEIAGYFNRDTQSIGVSQRFSAITVRFTAAHEIGHWALHRHLTELDLLHRDRPISGLAADAGRPRLEREADYFAACLLMPPNLVTKEFGRRFLRAPFVFDDASTFYFRPDDPECLLRPYEGSLDRETVLATARSFNTVPFEPLHQRFKVSITSMTIRLKELGLIVD